MTELELIAAVVLFGILIRENTAQNLFTAALVLISVGSILFYIINKIWSSVI